MLQTGGTQAPQPIADPAAYEIYNALIPKLWTVRFTTARSLVTLDTTARPPASCFPAGEAVEGLWSAVAKDFMQKNASHWALTRPLSLGRPYVSAKRTEIEALFAAKGAGDGWYDFQTLHPEALGFIEVSAVGFDRSASRAMVYISYSCGDDCGGGELHFLEKTDQGEWHSVKLQGNPCA